MSEPGPGRPEGAEPGSGILGSARGAARALLAFVETRARLAANDFEEQVVRLAEIGVWLGAALILFGLALVVGSVLLVMLVAEPNRALAAAIVTFLWFAGAAIAALLARKRMAERPKFFAATLAELARDREHAERS